ncbi:MAG TPA: ABC transporter permease [Candidatus Atribacteria bacterium]|nr:ABC transporter permease [Candidatus Atribacteria bacterium]
MRKIFLIGIKDVKIRARDPYSFIMLLVMPLVLILVLGMVFQPLWTSTPFTIDIAVLDEDGGEFSKILLEEVFGSEQLKDMIKMKFMESEEEIINEINKGKISAGVIIGEKFSQAILKGENTQIKILADPEQTIKAGVVKNIVESFTLEVLKRRIILGTSIGILVTKNLVNPAEIQQLIPGWLSEIENMGELIQVDKKTEKKMTKNPLAMEYYAVGMGVMYLLFATNAGAETIFQERRNKTLERIKVAPVSEREILGGKLFGIFLIALLQFVMIVFFTAIFYRVNWGDSLLGIIIMILSSVLAFSGLSTLLASLTKSEEQIGNIGPALAMIFGFMGGGMWPAFAFPDWRNMVSKLPPNRWAIDGFLKLMYQGGGVVSIFPEVLVLLGMAALFFSLGVFRLRTKGVKVD